MTVADQLLTQPSSSESHPPQTQLKVGIPKEVFGGECRVAATPNTAQTLQKWVLRC